MMFGFRNKFEYFECAQCDCLQINNIPDNLERYYPENYYAHKPINSPLTIFIPNNRFNIISHSGVDLNSRIIDVGCGDGSLIKYFGDMEYKNSIGIDPMIGKDIEFENGINIYKKNLDDIDALFDLIMFNHSFEHMSDPTSILKTVKNILDPGGICILRVPTVSSSIWLQYGVNWVAIDAPRHIFIPSIKSMNILCDNAGLTLDNIVYDSTILQFWGSEQYLKDIPLVPEKTYGKNNNNSIFSKSEINNFKRKTKELNALQLGDSAAFFIKNKRSS